MSDDHPHHPYICSLSSSDISNYKLFFFHGGVASCRFQGQWFCFRASDAEG
ncbi:hypothetical protein HanIR_Chr13g0645381 [Helianthus annuus]|nr:hypothetical protein HanIR_Chr13g0645381 [Helianthus annuus]